MKKVLNNPLNAKMVKLSESSSDLPENIHSKKTKQSTQNIIFEEDVSDSPKKK